MIVTDLSQAAARKHQYYLQIMRKAQQLNDQKLIRLILKKLADIGRTTAVSTANGCMVIPFPAGHVPPQDIESERPTLWMLIKLTLAIPGSVAALLMLAIYKMGPGLGW